MTTLFIYPATHRPQKFMDPSLLQKFRQQLASWITTRLETQRLPFQRLELCPRIITEQGPLAPDLVLWINRDSQLAGSLILLPDSVDDQVLAAGVSLARALGLGHFATWSAREVSIWTLAPGAVNRLQNFALPPANRVAAEDFERTLNALLEQLKIVTVTSTLSTSEYPVHYFANLCLHNLQELTPGLTISARITAGQTAADEWLEQAPREKAWMSLWRILFLLWHNRLPPGLQPERLEFAIHYAVTDLSDTQPSWLDIQDNEPPLPEGGAVRLHHLAGRLRQLGWPSSDRQASELVCLLLNEAGLHFGIEPPHLPWLTDHVKRWVACQPPRSAPDCALVAPRAYLAGWTLQASLREHATPMTHAETLQALDSAQQTTSAIAVLQDTRALGRNAREEQLLRLRQVWPSRRFELPRNAPAWLWDALYLAGLTTEELSLSLPQDWHRAPGAPVLWAILSERYQLAAAADLDTGRQALHFVRTMAVPVFLVHRRDHTIEVAAGSCAGQSPGTIQVWLKANLQVLELLHDGRLTGLDTLGTDWPESLTRGIYLYLQTRLGRYLWNLCSGQAVLPEFATVAEAARSAGVPLPNENILTDLGMIGSAAALLLPDPEALEREFAHLIGTIPELPEQPVLMSVDLPKTRRRSNAPSDQIATMVFVDGIPRFPEHYLMDVYRPQLTRYELCGPLDIATEFFDRICVQTIDAKHTLEVSGRLVAEALVLASYTEQAGVFLPTNEELLAELVARYRTDLQQLWDTLVRECRRVEPHRLAAVKLARKIWQQQGLPPESAWCCT